MNMRNEMQAYIDQCPRCYQTCLGAAMTALPGGPKANTLRPTNSG